MAKRHRTRHTNHRICNHSRTRFLRADTWAHALSHCTRLHNSTPHAVIKDTPARIIDPNFYVDAHHQYRFVFGDLICFPLQDHERLWKFDVKNDIGFYVGDEDSIKGGSVVYMPYTHNFLTRGNGHRILISDIQLLQWYSQSRDIRRNPLPYSIVTDAVMELLANRKTPASQNDMTQLLVTPALMNDGQLVNPPTPAVIQHVTQPPTALKQTNPLSKPRTALLPIPHQPASAQPAEPAPRHSSTNHTTSVQYQQQYARLWTKKTHNLPYSQQTTTANHRIVTSCAHTLLMIRYSPPSTTPGTKEEIETAKVLRAPDRELFILAIQKEVHSLITETKTLQPLTKTAIGYAENTDQKRVWKIRTTLKCKRKKKPNGEPDKHKARAAARGDTLRRAMIKAQVPLPASYSPTIMPLTFSLFLQLAVIRKLHMATMDIKSAYLNAPLPTTADWIITTLEPHIAEVCGLDPRRNTGSPMPCTACQTPAAYSISTTKSPF
jgi:hypothetical protein